MTPVDPPHQLDAEAILRGLGTSRIGRKVVVLPEINSTNTYALDHVAEDGTVVFAEYQTAGRGRRGRSWHAPRGAALTLTVQLIEPPGRVTPARWIMAGAIAVAQAITRETDLSPQLRWPNDLYIRGKKLAGILVETRRRRADALAVAIGIGINCLQHAAHFPTALRDGATSLEMESSHPIERMALARALLQRLDALLSASASPSDDELAEQWRELSADIGTRVRLLSDGQESCGQIIDVHPAAGLLLQLDAGGRRHFDPQTTSRL